MNTDRMAEIDEAPSVREGGPIFAFREAGAEYRSGRGLERECLMCRAVVADAEHRAICELAGIAPLMHGPRLCARCVRKQREADRWADRVIAEDDERRRPSRPPIGLRVMAP